MSRPLLDLGKGTARLFWLVFGLAAAAVAIASLFAAGEIGRSRAIAGTQARAEDAGTLALAILRGELEKQRALPVILARDPDVRQALAGGSRHGLDLKLEIIAREARAAVIYLLGPDGVAIAASNWNEPTSFVGSDYSFRDYFRGAVATGSAEQFALGTVSQRPGLYITRRIEEAGQSLGVIVVKVEFDRVEADWRALGGETYVVDRRGVVLLATIEDWRFRVEAPLDPATAAAIRDSLQFGAAPLTLLPLRPQGELVQGLSPLSGRYVQMRQPVPTTDWALEVLLPVDAVITSGRSQSQALVALVLMPGAALAAFEQGLGRVAQEVDQNLFELDRAGGDEDRFQRGRDDRRHAGLTQRAFQQGQRAFNDTGDGNGHKRPLAAPREAAQGLGDRADPVRQRDDPHQRAVGLGGVGALQEGPGILGIGAQGCQRLVDLMGNAGGNLAECREAVGLG